MGRPIADDQLAVGVSTAGVVGIIFPDGSDPYEIGPNAAETMGKALIAAAMVARSFRARNASSN